MRRKDSEGGEGRLCSRLEVLAVEVGIGIADFNLLEGKIRRGGKGDVVAETFRHGRVEDTDHVTFAIEDERAGVALCGEGAGLLIVVINGQFDGLDAKVVGSVGLQSSIASNCEVSAVTVLHHNKTSLPVTVETVGLG